MSKTPLYFIKKLSSHDLGEKDGEIYARNCWFSLQNAPTLKFFFNIDAGNITEVENVEYDYSFQMPNVLDPEIINLNVRRRENTLIFVLKVNSLARVMQLLPNEIFVIEQPSEEVFTIKIMKMDHPNYVRINDLLTIKERNIIRNKPIQICTNINPFD